MTQRADTEAPYYHATAALEAEIAGLRQVGELLRGQLESTRQDRDRSAEAATVALRALPEPPKSSLLVASPRRMIAPTGYDA